MTDTYLIISTARALDVPRLQILTKVTSSREC